MGFEVFTPVVMKSTTFRDITPCNPLKVNRRFGGTYLLHLQGLISRAWCQHESRWQAEVWRWKRYVPPKRRLNFRGLHGIISQKIVLFNRFYVLCNTVLQTFPYIRRNNKCTYIWLDALMTMTTCVGSTVSCDTSPCNHLEVRRIFGDIHGFYCRGVKLTTHLQLVPRSRKCGSIHPLPHMPSWRSA
jgi:hypothetical protein